MCLIIRKGQDPLVAQQDMTVYKVLDRTLYETEFMSPFQVGFYWDMNVLYSTTMEHTLETSCFDEFDNNLASKEFGEYWRESDKYQMIGAGFHSATTMDRLRYAYADVIVRCTIPAGSLYYVGVDPELIVSNQLIINEIVRKRVLGGYKELGDDE